MRKRSSILVLILCLGLSSCAVLTERTLQEPNWQLIEDQMSSKKIKLDLVFQQYQCTGHLGQEPCTWKTFKNDYITNLVTSFFKKTNKLEIVEQDYDVVLNIRYREKLLEGVRWYTIFSLGLIPGEVKREVNINIDILNKSGKNLKSYSFQEIYAFKSGFIYIFSGSSKSSGKIMQEINSNILNNILLSMQSDKIL